MMTHMIDLEIGFLALWLLMTITVAYAWFTRREPGRHRIPDLTPEDTHPYSPVYEGQLLSDFPGFPELGQLSARVAPSRERLATTTELRALAYEGDMETINREVAEWRRLLDTDWTTAA